MNDTIPNDLCEIDELKINEYNKQFNFKFIQFAKKYNAIFSKIAEFILKYYIKDEIDWVGIITTIYSISYLFCCDIYQLLYNNKYNKCNYFNRYILVGNSIKSIQVKKKGLNIADISLFFRDTWEKMKDEYQIIIIFIMNPILFCSLIIIIGVIL